MLTKLRLRNFKLFEDVEIELAGRVVFVGLLRPRVFLDT